MNRKKVNPVNGFIPHGTICGSVQCSKSFFGFPWKTKTAKAVCECNEGECAWSTPLHKCPLGLFSDSLQMFPLGTNLTLFQVAPCQKVGKEIDVLSSSILRRTDSSNLIDSHPSKAKLCIRRSPPSVKQSSARTITISGSKLHAVTVTQRATATGRKLFNAEQYCKYSE